MVGVVILEIRVVVFDEGGLIVFSMKHCEGYLY